MRHALLQKSKSVAKRQREDAEESKADKAAKKMRLEMRQRGHVVSSCCLLNTLPQSHTNHSSALQFFGTLSAFAQTNGSSTCMQSCLVCLCTQAFQKTGSADIMVHSVTYSLHVTSLLHHTLIVRCA